MIAGNANPSILCFTGITPDLWQSMTTDRKYSKVLLELKTHYQQTLAELEAETSQIKARLTSLDTLIDDPLLSSDLLSILQGEAKPKKTTLKASPSSGKRKSTGSKKESSQAKNKKTQEKPSSASSSSRPMQWPYTEMYKIDAIATIMQENAGNSVHVDDLILRLYGDLSGDDLKTERQRMNKTMYAGTKNNRWRKDPKESKSYIFEEKSQAKSKEAKTT